MKSEMLPNRTPGDEVAAKVKRIVNEILMKDDLRNEGDYEIIENAIIKAIDSGEVDGLSDDQKLKEIALSILAEREEFKQGLRDVKLEERNPGEPLERSDV